MPTSGGVYTYIWRPGRHPEYANWMIEATPAEPYGKSGADLAKVERNMRLRRLELRKHLTGSEEVLSLPVFPRLGARGFTANAALVPHPDGPTSRSLYVPDESIQPHPRFPTLTANIRKRRGEKVMIAVPVYKDACTGEAMARQAADILARDKTDGARIVEQLGPSSIYMDAMAFGMGASCLQVTLQAADVSQARLLYDQLAVVTPIMLALTAASPMWKGMLADTDVRWNVIGASVDDRSAEERGLFAHAGDGAPALPSRRILKSRYSSIDCFISNSDLNREEYTDVPVQVNGEAMTRLIEAGIDSRMARHVAHLWIREPLVIYREKLEQDADDNDHFENLQSTNWNTMRFKPPPSAAKNSHGIKWRVEFRPMEVSLTDFENAAFSAFIILLARAIVEEGLDLYMPISKIDFNMEAAHARDAATQKRFWFRQTHTAHASGAGGVGTEDNVEGGRTAPELVCLTVGEILNGNTSKGVVGLLERARGVLDREGCDGEERARLEGYLSFIGQRANGEPSLPLFLPPATPSCEPLRTGVGACTRAVPPVGPRVRHLALTYPTPLTRCAGNLKTTAAWLREFVLKHEDYRADSVVSESICHDLMVRCAALSNGRLSAPDLVPPVASLHAATCAAAEDVAAAAAAVRGSCEGDNAIAHVECSLLCQVDEDRSWRVPSAGSASSSPSTASSSSGDGMGWGQSCESAGPCCGQQEQATPDSSDCLATCTRLRTGIAAPADLCCAHLGLLHSESCHC